MKFPSLSIIVAQTILVVRRYPIELLAAVVGTYAAAQLTFRNSESTESLLTRLLFVAALALPSYLAVTIRGRFRGFTPLRRTIEYLVITVLLTIFFFSVNNPPLQTDFMRFMLLEVAAHLLVASAGFVGRGSTLAFWQFNRHLFIRIVTGAVFSLVLFAGLAGAFAAMKALFDIDFDGEIYPRLFIWIAGIFNTVFFLSGVPREAEILEAEQAYPKVLKVFAQFVLVPLVIIYLAILLAYEGKIIAQWQLPNGWVSNLIIAYGIAGILSILLVYPIRNSEGNQWVRLFARWFYLLLIPLVVLMFVAIGVRIGNYGFTEERVFVLALSVWLGGISVYYLLRPHADIRIIPVSLALLALVLSTGPASAFSISRRSQQARLMHLLEKNRLLENGRATKARQGQKISFADRKGISSTIEYLLNYHGTRGIQPLFNTEGLNKARWSTYDNTEFLLRSLNIGYVSPYETATAAADRTMWYSYSIPDVGLEISGYDVYLPFLEFRESNQQRDIHIRREGKDGFAVFRGSDRISPVIYPRQTLDKMMGKYRQGAQPNEIDIADMQLSIRGKGCQILVFYRRLGGPREHKLERLSFEGAIFIRWE